jgi:hypothetical protein
MARIGPGGPPKKEFVRDSERIYASKHNSNIDAAGDDPAAPRAGLGGSRD